MWEKLGKFGNFFPNLTILGGLQRVLQNTCTAWMHPVKGEWDLSVHYVALLAILIIHILLYNQQVQSIECKFCQN